jgi:hypothetical protein
VGFRRIWSRLESGVGTELHVYGRQGSVDGQFGLDAETTSEIRNFHGLGSKKGRSENIASHLDHQIGTDPKHTTVEVASGKGSSASQFDFICRHHDFTVTSQCGETRSERYVFEHQSPGTPNEDAVTHIIRHLKFPFHSHFSLFDLKVTYRYRALQYERTWPQFDDFVEGDPIHNHLLSLRDIVFLRRQARRKKDERQKKRSYNIKPWRR